MVMAEPNTNLLHPNTVIPTLTGHLEAGQHRLCCAVLGTGGDDKQMEEWQYPPVITCDEGLLKIRYNEAVFQVKLEWL